MHTVNLCSSGIDLDDLNKKLSKYPNIKGLICVPRHSNPSGEVFSDENITNLLKITKEYNPSFINLFDHAYLIHDFDETKPQTPIPVLADGLGALENVAVFTSFSKGLSSISKKFNSSKCFVLRKVESLSVYDISREQSSISL